MSLRPPDASARPHWRDFLDVRGPAGALLSWRKIEPRVGISRTTAWRLQRSGEFPKPYVISPGRVAYREDEIEAWRASRRPRGDDPPMPPEPRTAEPRSGASAAPKPSPGRRRPRPRLEAAQQIRFEF